MSGGSLVRRILGPVVRPVIGLATRGYVVGDTAPDALRFARRVAEVGFAASCGYWDARDDAAKTILAEHRAVLAGALEEPRLDLHLSLKLPPLIDHRDEVHALIETARGQGTTVFLDSHGVEAADDVQALLAELGGEGLGVAIPGRWRRSLEDVDRAIEAGAAVRVIKGQWADPSDPGRDLREGFLEVVERLAGRGSAVAVASHDAAVVAPALDRLGASDTPHEVELLFPLPVEPVRTLARERGVATRLYIPYGSAWLPYSLGKALRNPRRLGWLVRDLFRTRRSGMPRPHRAD